MNDGELLCGRSHSVKHTISVLHHCDVSSMCKNKTTSTFLSTISIAGVTATPGNVNIIAMK